MKLEALTDFRKCYIRGTGYRPCLEEVGLRGGGAAAALWPADADVLAPP